ncbi:hypothetical protein [Flavobacterium rhizosphaerae]|uniref:Lipoprotein n=1 Tax=Flavobacterium rhizosphaerae TaxID=3163298 RepID=A0ABW8YRY0_9FLAO
MRKMFLSAFVAATLLVSCSSDDSDDTNSNGGFSNGPVSGTIYNEDFTAAGGVARPITLSSTESLYIYLGTSALNCESSTANTPIWITVPAAEGTYKPQTDGHVQFRSTDGDSFEGAIDAEIEITSITETSVKGKVKATGFDDDENNINGTFEVPYCSLD